MKNLLISLAAAAAVVCGCAGSGPDTSTRDHARQLMALPDGGSLSSSLKRQGNIVLGGPESITGDAAAQEDRSAEVINAGIWDKAGALEFCYKEAVRDGQKLAGTVVVQFVISFSGLVKDAMVLRSDFNNDDLAECLARTFRTMSFPQIDKDSGRVTVVFPVIISSPKN